LLLPCAVDCFIIAGQRAWGVVGFGFAGRAGVLYFSCLLKDDFLLTATSIKQG
jgi:hypothetical protein